MRVKAYRLRLANPGHSSHFTDPPAVGQKMKHADLDSRIESFDRVSGMGVVRLVEAVDFKELEDAGVPWADIVDYE